MIAFYGCLLVLLADLFDKFERRYAIDIDKYCALPDRWIAWGTVDFATPRRYFALRLPSYSFQYCLDIDDYRMGQAALVYLTGRGWRRLYVF